MTKYIVGAVVIILIAISGFYLLQSNNVPAPEAPSLEVPTMQTYATTTFSIKYPGNFSVDDTYAYDQFEGKPIAGVKFTVPLSATDGTNLSSDSGVSVEWLPRAKMCTGDIYIVPNVRAFELTVGSTTYSVATTSGAAAGNIYEEQVFAITGSKPCTAVRYILRSGSIGDYPQPVRPDDIGRSGGEGEEGAVSEFNRADLLRTFDAIRDSLILNR